jgi:hypothetical protein
VITSAGQSYIATALGPCRRFRIVNAWASAENGDKAVRFAAAETVRWLEWAVRSYQSFVFGLALILFGAVIAVTGRVSRPIGYLMALCGPELPSAGMDYRQQRFLVREPDPHSPRNRPDPRVDRMASHSCSPNQDRSGFRVHLRCIDPGDRAAGERGQACLVGWPAPGERRRGGRGLSDAGFE